jgi:ABC-type branched-subunit amino acid transport system ATPase component
VALLGAIALVAKAWAALQAGSSAQLQPMLDAMILLAVLSVGGQGLIPLGARLRRRFAPPAPRRRRLLVRGVTALAPAQLSARGLTKHYGGVHALTGFALEVAAGEAVALVGANGSGKTTALRALAGAVPLDSGEIVLDGRSCTGWSPVEMAEAGVVRTLQRTAMFGSLTSLENVVVGAALRARHSGALRIVTATPKSRAEARKLQSAALDALGRVGLDDLADTEGELLDGFQRRLLMLASALATQPRLLLLDEPSAGAAPTEVAGLAAILRDVRAMGVSLVLVEHNVGLVHAVADRVVTMVDGRNLDGGLS